MLAFQGDIDDYKKELEFNNKRKNMIRTKEWWGRLEKWERQHILDFETKNYDSFVGHSLCPACGEPESFPRRCDCEKEYSRIIRKANNNEKNINNQASSE